MSVFLIYDSEEWSNFMIFQYLKKKNISITGINLEKDYFDLNKVLGCKMIINRVFPSSLQRGHLNAYKKTGPLFEKVFTNKIFMLNSYEAFLNDFSKKRAHNILKKNGLPVPEIYNIDLLKNSHIDFPLITKPDCSGRSKNTFIINNSDDLKNIKRIESSEMILQKFIYPELGFTSRIEILGSEPMIVLKRFINEDGMSSYHSGSKYEIYENIDSKIINTSLKALKILNIEMGSLDIIEKKNGEFYIIDVNATSNFSEDNIQFLKFDPIKKFSDYIYRRYSEILL